MRHLLWAAAMTGLLSGCAALRSSTPTPLSAQVVRISEEYANINTDLTGARLQEAGIVVGSTFGARCGDEVVDVMLGTSYSDVDRGEWVGLIEENGTLQVAISFGHAADVLGCAVGDRLVILPGAAR